MDIAEAVLACFVHRVERGSKRSVVLDRHDSTASTANRNMKGFRGPPAFRRSDTAGACFIGRGSGSEMPRLRQVISRRCPYNSDPDPLNYMRACLVLTSSPHTACLLPKSLVLKNGESGQLG